MANKTSEIKRLKTFCGILSLVILLWLSSCNQLAKGNSILNNNGDKILIVEIYGENVSGNDEVTEVSLINNALQKGGSVTLNVDVLRQIDPQFDSKYTASNSNGQFYIRPAILNFIGGQGWHLLQIFGLPGNPQYFFVKTRENLSEIVYKNYF